MSGESLHVRLINSLTSLNAQTKWTELINSHEHSPLLNQSPYSITQAHHSYRQGQSQNDRAAWSAITTQATIEIG